MGSSLNEGPFSGPLYERSYYLGGGGARKKGPEIGLIPGVAGDEPCRCAQEAREPSFHPKP